jgi:hypothetical protein
MEHKVTRRTKGFKQYKNGSKGKKPRTEKKIPVGARFFDAVQTGPVAHPVSYKMGTGSISRR